MTDGFQRSFLRGLVVVGLVSAVALGGYLAFARFVEPAAPVPGDHDHHAEAAPFFDDLFKVYTPRQACMYHEAPLVWLHLLSDLFIGIAYFSIPVALVYFVRKRRDIQFNWVFWMFAAFILLCGTTHFIGVWDLWQPMYKIDGLVKALTAAVSIATAVMLWPLVPKALSVPTPAQLEQRVTERTQELAEANEALRIEAEARHAVEAEREYLMDSERAARSEAERASRMKDEFLATLSHELRSPIHAVLGWCQILQASDSPARLQEGLAVITRNARAQNKLIEDLLDMNRIVSGRLRLDVRPVDLVEVIRSALESVRPAADTKELRLQALLDPHAGLVSGDAERLQQVMWNLLFNAIKFTPKGGRIQVALERVGSHVEVTVTDTGEGIDPQFLPHLFERFSQADASTTRRFGGLGLGLAIVRHIVELHGGSVRASSEGKGKGATFVVLLPLRAATAETAAPPEPFSELDRRSLAGTTIVAIDDEPDARELLATILRDAGAHVITAGSAEEGLEHLKREKPHVLLCDLGLPGQDGFTLIRRVRALPPEAGGRTPAIAVTAFARSEDRTRALLAGFQAHLPKPFAADELIATIGGLTGRFGGPRW